MSKQASKAAKATTSSPKPNTTTNAPALNPQLWAIGLLALVVAIGASGILTASSIGLFKAPGCGEGGGCDGAATSFFGGLPFSSDPTNHIWPVSFLGFAYACAMLIAWFLSPKGISAGVRWMARAGALTSLFYIVVLIVKRNDYFCAWCLTTHIANLIFLACVELGSLKARAKGTPAAIKSVIAAGLAFFIASGAIAITNTSVKAAQRAADEQAAAEAMQAILDNADNTAPTETATPEPVSEAAAEPTPQPKSKAPAQSPAQTPAQPPAQTTQQAAAAGPPLPSGTGPLPSPQPEAGTIEAALWHAARDPRQGLRGHFIMGPEAAEVRIVTAVGYQCGHCQIYEKELIRIMEKYPDQVNVSALHYPVNPKCNPYAGRAAQANGCWASRAAEAAGILGGPDAFEIVHKGIFEKKGRFSSLAELQPLLLQAGINPAQFQQTLMSQQTLDHVIRDAHMGKAVGVFQTPTVWVNGTEFRGWGTPGNTEKFVDQLIASGQLPKLTNASDPRPDVKEKLFEDFLVHRNSRVDYRTRLGAKHAQRSGPADADVQVLISASLARPNTANLINLAQATLADLPSTVTTSLTVIHDPLEYACDPQLQSLRQGQPPIVPAGMCELHHALQAVAEVGSAEHYLATWEWALAELHAAPLTPQSTLPISADSIITHAAQTFSLDEQQLRAQLNIPTTQRIVREQAAASRASRNGSPVLYVNGQYVPPASSTQQDALRRIFEHKAK